MTPQQAERRRSALAKKDRQTASRALSLPRVALLPLPGIDVGSDFFGEHASARAPPPQGLDKALIALPALGLRRWQRRIG